MKELQQEYSGLPILFTTLNMLQTDQQLEQQRLLEQALGAEHDAFYRSVHPSAAVLAGDPTQPTVRLLTLEQIAGELRSIVDAAE